ncbi:hypothetical protein F183_A01920 [Bryobacterales bacterium F-183]|nr:hypothetical protein F183_A01920 [Bryobacterales bacterium F-183]
MSALIAQALLPNRSRVVVWIKAQPGGLTPVHAAAGISELDEPAKLVFSRNLEVRGVSYGHLQVELLDVPASPGVLLTALEVVAIQTALRAEIWRLEASKARLKHLIATEKVVARASGLISQDRGLSAASARQWLQDEAARNSRPLRWVADMLVTGRRLLGPGAAQKREAAA